MGSGSSRDRRAGSITRRSGNRKTRRKTLVVCEGKTEYNYFTGLRDGRSHDIHPVKPETSKHPQRDRVVNHARAAQDRAAYSEVWAVFDSDGHDVRDLCAQAKKIGVEVAVSVPTFEVWLILHKGTRPGPLTPAQAEQSLKRLESRWSKGDGTRFEHFSGGLRTARDDLDVIVLKPVISER